MTETNINLTISKSEQISKTIRHLNYWVDIKDCGFYEFSKAMADNIPILVEYIRELEKERKYSQKQELVLASIIATTCREGDYCYINKAFCPNSIDCISITADNWIKYVRDNRDILETLLCQP